MSSRPQGYGILLDTDDVDESHSPRSSEDRGLLNLQSVGNACPPETPKLQQQDDDHHNEEHEHGHDVEHGLHDVEHGHTHGVERGHTCEHGHNHEIGHRHDVEQTHSLSKRHYGHVHSGSTVSQQGHGQSSHEHSPGGQVSPGHSNGCSHGHSHSHNHGHRATHNNGHSHPHNNGHGHSHGHGHGPKDVESHSREDHKLLNQSIDGGEHGHHNTHGQNSGNGHGHSHIRGHTNSQGCGDDKVQSHGHNHGHNRGQVHGQSQGHGKTQGYSHGKDHKQDHAHHGHGHHGHHDHQCNGHHDHHGHSHSHHSKHQGEDHGQTHDHSQDHSHDHTHGNVKKQHHRHHGHSHGHSHSHGHGHHRKIQGEDHGQTHDDHSHINQQDHRHCGHGHSHGQSHRQSRGEAQKHAHSHHGHSHANGHCDYAWQSHETTIHLENSTATDSSSGDDSSAAATTSVYVHGICCPSEVPIIERILFPVPGVRKIEINVIGRVVHVSHDSKLPPDRIVEVLNQARLGAKLLRRKRSTETGFGDEDRRAPLCPRWNVCLGVILWGLSLISMMSKDVECLRWLALGSIALTLPPIAIRACSAVRLCILDIHCLMFCACLGAVAVGDYFEGAAVVSLFGLSGWLEDRASAKVKEAMASVAQLQANEAVKLSARDEGTSSSLESLQEESKSAGNSLATSSMQAHDSPHHHHHHHLGSENENHHSLTNNESENENGLGSIAEFLDAFEKTVIHAEDVCVGDLIEIMPGAKIPVDGEVIRGSGLVDQAILTGESKPVRVESGSTVSGGMMLVGGHIIVRATELAEDSVISQLVSLVERAQAQRSPTERLVTSVARYYTPIVLIAAILMAAVPWMISPHSRSENIAWFRRSLILVVTACPCALLISTPIAYALALAVSAKNGILVKGGENLEALMHISGFAFDKTGTLTDGSFVVEEFKILHQADEHSKVLPPFDILSAVISVEEASPHPVAHALTMHAKGNLMTMNHSMENKGRHGYLEDLTATDFAVLDGKGVVARWHGHHVYIGNTRGGLSFGENEKQNQRTRTLNGESVRGLVGQWEREGCTAGWVCIDGTPCACYKIRDSVRPSAQTAVSELSALGYHCVMLTGDNEGASRAAAALVGIQAENVKAGLLPKDKIESVKMLSNEFESVRGRCCARDTKAEFAMVGDGVNDAPALATARVGISMGSEKAAKLAMETADVVLLENDLNKLLWLMNLSRCVANTIKQNVTVAFFAKAVMLVCIAFGYAALWMAVVVDIGSMLLVTMNSTRLMTWWTKGEITQKDEWDQKPNTSYNDVELKELL